MELVQKNAEKNGIMLDVSLVDYLKGKGAKSATKVVGPNGAFISWIGADDSINTLPVGHKSQNGTIGEYKLIQAENGTIIATVNEYKTAETVEF